MKALNSRFYINETKDPALLTLRGQVWVLHVDSQVSEAGADTTSSIVRDKGAVFNSIRLGLVGDCAVLDWALVLIHVGGVVLDSANSIFPFRYKDLGRRGIASRVLVGIAVDSHGVSVHNGLPLLELFFRVDLSGQFFRRRTGAIGGNDAGAVTALAVERNGRQAVLKARLHEAAARHGRQGEHPSDGCCDGSTDREPSMGDGAG